MTTKGELMTIAGEKQPKLDGASYFDTEQWAFPDFGLLGKEEVSDLEFQFDNAELTGTGRQLMVGEVCIWHEVLDIHTPRVVRVGNPFPRVQMTFNLEGTASYYSEKLGKVFVRFNPQQHNVTLVPEGDIVLEWKAGQSAEAFVLSLSPAFFFEALPESHRLYGHFRNAIGCGLPAFMSLRNLPVTPKMTDVLFQILHCPYEGYHKSLFVKVKVIELLILQFEQYEQMPPPDFSSALKTEHREQMQLVKQILLENLDKNWSLKDLAHQVGTNEFNLKKYFKEVFGATVFGYLHEVRMETSKRMLSEPGAVVSEIAQRMGYKHATHFTAAFKKYHGILPMKLRPGLG